MTDDTLHIKLKRKAIEVAGSKCQTCGKVTADINLKIKGHKLELLCVECY